MEHIYKNGVSVIICCYNSSWIIYRCLDALTQQQLPIDFNWEILIVNNNCSDNTCEIAKDIMQSTNIAYRIVNESKPGLLYARIKGVKEANYKYCIFCDDDNLLDHNYVYVAYRVMELHQDAGAFAGQGMPEFLTTPEPEVREYLGGYAVGSQKNKTFLFGAGLTVRTDIVSQIYTTQKFYLTGRKGSVLLAGDDTELILSLILRGYKLYTSDDISYIHVLAPRRLTYNYLREMIYGFGLSSTIIDLYCEIFSKKKNALLRIIIRRIGSCIKQCFRPSSLKRDFIQIKNKGFFDGIKLWGFVSLKRTSQDLKKLRKQFDNIGIDNNVHYIGTHNFYFN